MSESRNAPGPTSRRANGPIVLQQQRPDAGGHQGLGDGGARGAQTDDADHGASALRQQGTGRGTMDGSQRIGVTGQALAAEARRVRRSAVVENH